MINEPALWLFWGSVGFILYVYFGFPILLALRGLLRAKAIRRDITHTPTVTMIIVGHNEANVIREKLENVFALDYPQEQLEVIFASDGSFDSTEEIVAQYEPRVKLVQQPRQGKNLTLNTAVSAAQGEILFFSDADSMLPPDALRHLVAPFADKSVGGVGGDYRYPTALKEGFGERLYWRFDRLLKRMQSAGGSMTSATGQIYAIRRSLFKPAPMSVTDDFHTSTQVPAAHYRLVFEPRAVAYGPIAPSTKAEFRRKVRSVSRGIRGVWTVRHLLNPVRYGFYAIQLLSHKLLRRLIGLPVILMFISAPLLWKYGWFYQTAAVGQLLFHGAAAIGYLLSSKRIGQWKIFSLPLYFDMVYVAALIAVYNLLTGKRYDIWGAERAAMEKVSFSE